MKILKEPSVWKKEKKCTGKGHGYYGCGALLEIEVDDISWDFESKSYWSYADQEMCSYIDYFYNFQCPCCKIKTRLEEKEIPKNIRKQLLNSDKFQKEKKKYLKKME